MKRVLLSVLAILFITAAQALVAQQINFPEIARNSSGISINYPNNTFSISLIDTASGGQVVTQSYRTMTRIDFTLKPIL